MARSIRAVALDYLARRECSRYELDQKLRLKEFDVTDIALTLDRLELDNLQSDDRFAESFLHQRVNSGSGPIKIKMELSQRGVSDTIMNAVFSKFFFDWEALASALWERKFPMPAANLKEKAQRQRFMLQRGFALSHFKRLL